MFSGGSLDKVNAVLLVICCLQGSDRYMQNPLNQRFVSGLLTDRLDKDKEQLEDLLEAFDLDELEGNKPKRE